MNMDNKHLRELLGKLVSSENEDNWWRQELFEKYTRSKIPAGLEILSPPPSEEQNYNCFVYVLGLQNNENFLGNKGWDFTRNLDLIFDEMIREKIFKPLSKPEVGSMILYRAHDNSISHVGIMEDENTVISKWSWGPLLRHKILDVPDHYGEKIEFYIISEKAGDLILSRHHTLN